MLTKLLKFGALSAALAGIAGCVPTPAPVPALQAPQATTRAPAPVQPVAAPAPSTTYSAQPVQAAQPAPPAAAPAPGPTPAQLILIDEINDADDDDGDEDGGWGG